MRSFDFKKSYEEIKINDRVYKIDLSDEKVKEYYKEFISFESKSLKLQAESIKAITPEEQEKFVDESKSLVGHTLDVILGKGSFDHLYIDSGKSLLNMIDLIMFLTDVIKEKTESIREETLNKYLNKKGE